MSAGPSAKSIGLFNSAGLNSFADSVFAVIIRRWRVSLSRASGSDVRKSSSFGLSAWPRLVGGEVEGAFASDITSGHPASHRVGHFPAGSRAPAELCRVLDAVPGSRGLARCFPLLAFWLLDARKTLAWAGPLGLVR